MSKRATKRDLEVLLDRFLELVNKDQITLEYDNSRMLYEDICQALEKFKTIEANEIALSVDLVEKFDIPYYIDENDPDSYTVKIFIEGKEIRAEVNSIL